MVSIQSKKGRRGYHKEGWPVVWHRSAKKAISNNSDFIEATDHERNEMIKDWCRAKLLVQNKKTVNSSNKNASGVDDGQDNVCGVTFSIKVDAFNYTLEIDNKKWHYSKMDNLYAGLIERVARKMLMVDGEREVSLSEIVNINKKAVLAVMKYIGVSDDISKVVVG